MVSRFGREHLVLITVFDKTSLAQHETDQSKSCLFSESSLKEEEIKFKLRGYNEDLNHLHIPHIPVNYFSFDERTLTRLRKELEELIPCFLTPELLPYLQAFLECDACENLQLISHHVLAILDHPARENFNSADKWNITFYYKLRCYFYLFYKDTNPEVAFDLIHKVWKNHPWIEFILRLLCCQRLLENKQYGILNHLIQYNEEYFSIVQKNFRQDQIYFEFDLLSELYGPYLSVALVLLCNNMTSRQTEKNETVLKNIIVKHISNFTISTPLSIRKGCEYFMLLTLSLKQTRLIPSLIKVLLNRPELHNISTCIISLCNERLLKVDCHKMSMDFIKDNSHYILNVPFILEKSNCSDRQKYCKLLLTLLHAYMMCEDITNMNLVLKRLQEFRQSLLSSTYKLCACFMGKRDCHLGWIRLHDVQDRKNMNRFKSSLLSLSINTIRNKVIKEELRPDCYLTQMIDAVEKYIDFREDLIEEFISFIEQISLHNETGLYDIIKTLCDLEMQPEIQDMFIQGLTDYIHVTCNKQNSMYPSLLLDINMTCYKGEFLKKLTINMGQLLLLDVDTGNDVEKIIYRCFCKVRHENIDTDIAKYQVYFTFISTMDAEEKIMKMSNLRSFLLMLILLMISSGSQHKSAKLKKYLSLKYAYEDAILYLLWCSGDVEINPGPTLKKLRPQADSVKKRNWIHEMCTTALKLLKNIALDSKSDGMWKEKPDNWQELHGGKLFYDPRNKPKSEQLSIEDDKELMNCLLECCDKKDITLLSNFQREITAWKNDKPLYLEFWVARQEIKAMRMAMGLLVTYSETPDLKQILKDCNVDLSFNSNGTQEVSPKGYSDVVRELAITFCRISKDLPILEKKDGIWKTPPDDWICWNPKDAYKDPCNTGKGQGKPQDQTLVDYLLFYCERKSIPIPSELQLVANAWKERDSQEICKHYTIWSSMAIIQHSLKYLELEGLLEKPHVQQSLKQLGVSLHCERDPKHFNSERTTNTDNEVSGLLNHSLSENQRGTDSSSSDIVYGQQLYEAKALTNSKTMKSVIKCPKPDFQNQPSTSGCTIYSTLVPCPDSRGDLQSTDERLEFSDSHTILSEILYEGTDFQSSISSRTTYSKRAPCRENSGDIQYTDEKLDIHDSHKCVSEILCQEPDFQPSSSGYSTFTNRVEYLNVRENIPPTERIQKRRRPSSEERLDKRPRLHSGNESQASMSAVTKCNGDTTPSSHCDSYIADQCENSTGTMEDSSDQSSNQITLPDNIQDTDCSKDYLFGPEDEIPQHLEEIIDSYIIKSCDNQEENLGEDLEHIDRLLKWWETL